MASVLFTWELGMGLGHILPIKSLAQHFINEGHEVFVALKDLKHGHTVFQDTPVKLLQAPFSQSPLSSNAIACYSQLLASNGFEQPDELMGLCLAWQSLFDLIKVDILLVDHSPSALLAARGLSIIKANIGTGFTIPPNSKPFAHFQPKQSDQQLKQSLIEHESHTLMVCNHVLKKLNSPLLNQLGDLYADPQYTGILSLPEFDHFTQRKADSYLGITAHKSIQSKPNWPNTAGKKIFIYLKSFEHLKPFLHALVDTQAAIIFYSNDIQAKQFSDFQAPHIHYETQALDLDLVAAEADIAITNGNHSTLMHFILHKVPVMMIPLHWEQQLMALRMQAQGIGVIGNKNQPAQLIQSLKSILRVNGCSDAVRNLADKYQDFDAAGKQRQFCQRLISAAKTKKAKEG
jgi:UDP:flavonoid glycosyltransferase YjiC (YdhE family)